MATLDLMDVRKSFGATKVLHGVDLHVADGEMIVIVGASGCGKSTLLRIVAGLETATSGHVRIEGRDVTALEPADRDIAMVFQNYALYPHMTVAQNMGYGLKIRGLPRGAARGRAEELLGFLGLSERLDHRPSELSGGEQQRVAIARAVANAPRLLLADEPTGNLDPHTAGHVFSTLVALVRASGLGALIATHNLELAGRMDRRITLHEGEVVPLA